MSLLFEIKDKTVRPKPEILLTPPFKEIWERDTSDKKETAIKEMTYAEFTASEMSTNPYSGYPPNERRQHILEDVIRDENWVPDTLVRSAVEYLETLQLEGSFSYAFYIAAREAAVKTRDFFTHFDMNERNERTNAPIFKVKEINDAIIKSDEVIEKMLKMRQKVIDEVFESTRTKKDKVISEFQL